MRRASNIPGPPIPTPRIRKSLRYRRLRCWRSDPTTGPGHGARPKAVPARQGRPGPRPPVPAAVEPENLVHQLDQLVDPVVVDAILDGGKLAELPAETENVPGIDHRPALNRAVQKVLDLRRQHRRLIRLTALDRQVGRGQPAVDLAPAFGRRPRARSGLVRWPPP